MTVVYRTPRLLRTTHVVEVMGTVVSFDVRTRSPHDERVRAELLPAACELLRRADEVFSTWKPDSPMSRVRSGQLALEDAPDELAHVLALCAEIESDSRGWFAPWSMPGGVDPTGLVKGWAVERALDLLHVPGVDAALVNAGGDVAVFGRPESDEHWRVGIRHPWRPDALACIVHVDAAVATSGTYERGTHLVDPRSGAHQPAAASATVTGPSLARADALATALAVGGDDALDAIVELPGYEGYLVRRDGTERWSAGMRFAPTSS